LPDEHAVDVLARRLSEAGAQRILARMKGASS